MYKEPPYTDEEIKSFNAYQESGIFHPFTCGVDRCHTNLEADRNELKCPACLYRQFWGYPWMFDWSWKSNTMYAGDKNGKDWE